MPTRSPVLAARYRSHADSSRNAANGETQAHAPRVAVYLPKRSTSAEIRELKQLARNSRGRGECKNILVLAAVEQPASLTRLPGLDFVTVPTLHSCADGAKSPANVSERDRRTLDVRSNVLAAALEAYRPDLFIVSRLPRGLGDELLASLAALRADSRAHCILELAVESEDVQQLRREWHEFGYAGVLESLYDSVWVRSSDSEHLAALTSNLPSLDGVAVLVPAASADGAGGGNQLVARVRRWLTPEDPLDETLPLASTTV